MNEMKVSAVLRAIRKQARRITNGKSRFGINDHANAIIALANIGSDLIRKKNEKKVVAVVGSNAKVKRERKGNTDE